MLPGKSLFSTPKVEPLPEPEPVTPMPEMDDEAIKNAKKKKAAELTTRSGRLSTILSDAGGSDKLGS